jgi:hypothetical protein
MMVVVMSGLGRSGVQFVWERMKVLVRYMKIWGFLGMRFLDGNKTYHTQNLKGIYIRHDRATCCDNGEAALRPRLFEKFVCRPATCPASPQLTRHSLNTSLCYTRLAYADHPSQPNFNSLLHFVFCSNAFPSIVISYS